MKMKKTASKAEKQPSCDEKEENQSATTKPENNKTVVNKTENNKTVVNKTENNKTVVNKTENNKTVVNKTENNKTVVNKIENKFAASKTDAMKKLKQTEQIGKQTAKKTLPEQSARNPVKKKILPTVKKNLTLQKEKVVEKGKQCLQKRTAIAKPLPRKEKPLAEKEKLQECCSRCAAKSVAADNVDAWLYKEPKRTAAPVIEKEICVRSQVDAYSEVYNMNHRRTGVAIILNHRVFKSMKNRAGADKDTVDLSKTLDKLNFEVRVFNDPTLKKIMEILETTAAEDHTDADCLVVVAMTHGESNTLHSYENQYSVDMLWTSFTGEQCPTLIGKPKLFFIQACRGTKLDNPMKIFHETDSVSAYTIPSHADIMIAYSTYEGFLSWRNPDTGSWFIQALCQELNEKWRSHDLLSIMTSVVRRVAIGYQSYVPIPGKEHMDGKKQIPSIVSMLTRLVYFSDKSSQ